MKIKLTLIYCAFGAGDSFLGRYKFTKEIHLPIAYDGLKVIITLNEKDSIPFTLKDIVVNENGKVCAKLFFKEQSKLTGFEKYGEEDAYCANYDGPKRFKESSWLIEDFPIID